MKNFDLENLLNSEMENVEGGRSEGTCVCTSGAGETVVVISHKQMPKDPIKSF